MQFSFPISDHNILDRLGVFFCRASNDLRRHWRPHLDLVGHLDIGSMRKRTSHFEQGRRDTLSKFMVARRVKAFRLMLSVFAAWIHEEPLMTFYFPYWMRPWA